MRWDEKKEGKKEKDKSRGKRWERKEHEKRRRNIDERVNEKRAIKRDKSD